MALDDRTNSPLDEEEKNKVILDGEKEEVTEELIDVLAKSENTDFSNMDDDDLMKGINEVISGADLITDKLGATTTPEKKHATDSMSIEEILGIEKITVEEFESLFKEVKMKPIMSMFDEVKGSLDAIKSVEFVYGGDYVENIIKRLQKNTSKKVLENREFSESEEQEDVDGIEAARKLLLKLNEIVSKTSGGEGKIQKLLEKVGDTKGIKFLIEKSGYLDSLLQKKIDTAGDALRLLKDTESSYTHRIESLKSELKGNATDYKTLKRQKEIVIRLSYIIQKIYEKKRFTYDNMIKDYATVLESLPEYRKPQVMTYKAEFDDDIIQLKNLVDTTEQYKEFLNNIEINTRIHLKLIKTLYQKLKIAFPQTKTALVAILQQSNTVAVEQQIIESEEGIRNFLRTSLTVIRKNTAKAVKNAENLSTTSIFEKDSLKKENKELRKIESSFDKARMISLQEDKLKNTKEEIASIVDEVKLEEEKVDAVFEKEEIVLTD